MFFNEACELSVRESRDLTNVPTDDDALFFLLETMIRKFS